MYVFIFREENLRQNSFWKGRDSSFFLIISIFFFKSCIEFTKLVIKRSKKQFNYYYLLHPKLDDAKKYVSSELSLQKTI